MRRPPPLTLGNVTLDWTRPVLMGVINLTPDSFSDGGAYADLDVALEHARALCDAGATILDVGGESTRPGAEPVPAPIEIERVVPFLERLRDAALPAVISIDTRKAKVAEAAMRSGAHVINDVSALGDPEMLDVATAHDAALILMHMRGQPQTMQQGEILYRDAVGEVRDVLAEAARDALEAGIPKERIWLDPGIGFGKGLDHNLSLTKHLDALAALGHPVVYGPSRKRFLGTLTGRPVEDRDAATAAACVAAILAGAHVLRVHNVAAIRDAVAVATAVRDAR